MSGKVYADGDEVVSKGADGKVSSAFPDVCMSPPGPPVGPFPVPYPNSSSARDLKNGSKSVRIRDQPVGLSDESYFATSPLGNEAATRNFGASIVTHTITGKTYFASWSMDVKVEGKGVLRHMDLTTSNHGSYPGGTPPFPNLSRRQLLALERLKRGMCPCCGKNDCKAAPSEENEENLEPLSLEEYYEIDSRPGRREQYEILKRSKQEECTCHGRVFPKPPCDVFRKIRPNQTRSIDNEWNGASKRYREDYFRNTGIRLKGPTDFQRELKEATGRMDQLNKAGKISSALINLPQNAGFKPDYDLLKKIETEANELARINHLTPKSAGGCPTSSRNLQPHQTLCNACQEIDRVFSIWQNKKQGKTK